MSEISKSGEELIDRYQTASFLRKNFTGEENKNALKLSDNVRQFNPETGKDTIFMPLGGGAGYVQLGEDNAEMLPAANVGNTFSIPMPKNGDSEIFNEYISNLGRAGKSFMDIGITGGAKGIDWFTDAASDVVGKYMQFKLNPNMFDGKSMPEINPKEMLMDATGFKGIDLSMFEPQTEGGKLAAELVGYIVAGTLTPGGPGSLATKLTVKDAGALFAGGPEVGNLFTIAEALGMENDIVSFLNAKMENPDDATADERLSKRIAALVDIPLLAGAFFVAAKTLGNRAFQLAATTATGTSVLPDEAEGMGSGPLAKFVKNSLKKGVKPVDNLPQPGAVNQVDDTVYQRNDKGDLVPQPKIDPQDNIARIEAPTDNKPGIIAFHGSGADFDEFRLDKIGTGEGAQKFGYGLYFSEMEDIAKFYKGKDSLKKSVQKYSKEELDVGKRVSGKTYKVELLPKPEELLNYDLPFSKQTDFVKNALRKASVVTDDFMGSSIKEMLESGADIPGKEFIETLKKIDGTGQASSQFLNKFGIKGITFSETGRKGIQPITYRNYVIFDDAAVNILAKYGIVGPVAVTALSKPEPTKNEQ
tara:strand:- start:4022 stop:5785 length:1764 start_codon:yes stop_codon:yes gene_type:complete